MVKFMHRHHQKLKIDTIEMLMDRLAFAENMDALRGYEGKAATVYFQALGSLFTGYFAFDKRTKFPVIIILLWYLI